jgi:hypothetical protein
MSFFRTADKRRSVDRYRLLPQLRDYDAVGPYPRPYTVFGARSCASTDVVSTDALGYRRSRSAACGVVDTGNWAQVGGGLVVGGSFVFGVGATADAHSIPSLLAGSTGAAQLNLGIVGANAAQELISALPFLDSARTVAVCTGFNTAYASLQSLGLNEVYGPLFFEGAIADRGADRLTPSPDGIPPMRNEVRPAAVPSGGELTERDMAVRLDAAASRQLRALATFAAVCRDRARLLFCLQPLADPELRDLVPQEAELFDALRSRRYASPWQGVTGFLAANWCHYRDRLAAGCAELSVDFVDLAADRFAGWSFVDRVHMTDLGYRQAAELIGEAL